MAARRGRRAGWEGGGVAGLRARAGAGPQRAVVPAGAARTPGGAAEWPPREPACVARAGCGGLGALGPSDSMGARAGPSETPDALGRRPPAWSGRPGLHWPLASRAGAGAPVPASAPGAHRARSPPAPGIEELCQKREELCRQIQQEEEEKQRLQNEVRQLTEKLARVNENLARKIASRNEFDRTIAETEAAYLKILESSQTLLSVLKREAGNLTKATASEQKSSGGKES